jgi:error-prone DNA polymerase
VAPDYIELHAASAFSFLQGASLPEALVDRAADLGYSAIALLDRDGVYGAPRFHKAATSAGLKPIIGAELTVENQKSEVRSEKSEVRSQKSSNTSDFRLQTSNFLLPVLCESQEGYHNLCRLITRMKLRAPKGEGALTLDEIEGCTNGLVVLVGRAALDARRHGVGGLLDRLIGVFGRDRVYVELQRHFRRDGEADNAALSTLASAYHVPTIATNGVRFATPAERPLFDVLTCIHHGTTLAEAGRRLAPNAERYLKPPGDMADLFRDRPDAVAGTRELADRLQYTMANLGYRFPDYPVPAGETQMSFLRQITEVGALERYASMGAARSSSGAALFDRARAQIARELDLIEKLQLAGYFLIVWDIVNFCRQHDVLVQGRGSAANSAVCYSLGITAVDPVKMDLLFERFLSEERGEWPDIDLDLPSGDRREQVIQHVYEKYGRLGAAMTANVITYRGRSAAREAGKALGFDPVQIDRLAKIMNQFEFADPADTLPRQMSAVGLDLNSDRVRLFARLWREMLDLPRHLGQHSGGMVICQGQLDAVVPLENASMPGRVVVQWDKDDCADMGIVKVDLLGLGMMAVIQDALALVNGDQKLEVRSQKSEVQSTSDFRLQTSDLRIDLAHLPENDPAVYKMLCEADTIGVFQVESRAQMATLPRLQPACFYDIVVEVAIIRPGPIVGQMVHPYLNRRAGREAVQYPYPSLEPILARTLGVPLFQEQLLRMAMVAAGFTGGQAEELRRAFGFKRSERRMKAIEVQLRAGMARQGITGAAADQIVTSITSFALYGFPESHAASFALLAYASAYLKAHYPAAFYTALLNNQPMGFYHPATLVKDAQRRGVRFRPIDVQISNWECTVEADGAIRLGLRYVSGLREQAGRAICTTNTWSASRSDERPRSTALRHARGIPSVSTDEALALQTGRLVCPKCGCDDASMLESTDRGWFCNVCSHEWGNRSGVSPLVTPEPRSGEGGPVTPQRSEDRRFKSLDELVARAGLRRDEVVTLADVGALNSFGYDRRSALWQAERAVRPSGELFEEAEQAGGAGWAGWTEASDTNPCPLRPMTESERLVADYAGMGLSIGRHPMALRRDELAMRGILRASDLHVARQGRRVRVAGMVITRQRPGTAKGFVFLTLEDESGIANIIVRPDLFARDRLVIVEEQFLIVDGVLQNQDGVTSVRAEAVQGMRGVDFQFDAHDFY